MCDKKMGLVVTQDTVPMLVFSTDPVNRPVFLILRPPTMSSDDELPPPSGTLRYMISYMIS